MQKKEDDKEEDRKKKKWKKNMIFDKDMKIHWHDYMVQYLFPIPSSLSVAVQ